LKLILYLSLIPESLVVYLVTKQNNNGTCTGKSKYDWSQHPGRSRTLQPVSIIEVPGRFENLNFYYY